MNAQAQAQALVITDPLEKGETPGARSQEPGTSNAGLYLILAVSIRAGGELVEQLWYLDENDLSASCEARWLAGAIRGKERAERCRW